MTDLLRHRHVPLHRRRRLDAAPAQAWRRSARCRARRAPPNDPGACSAEAASSRHTGRRAFFFAFPTAPGALDAASAFTDALAPGAIRVRVGLRDTVADGRGLRRRDAHRARIAAAGHGGQVLVSRSRRRRWPSNRAMDLGEHRLEDCRLPSASISSPAAIFRRSRAFTEPTCRSRRPRSSGANGSSSRWSAS